MKCEPAREKLHDFLEDLIPEDEWEKMRDHLQTCPSCSQFALNLGTFSSDLRHLGSLKIPFDLGRGISQEIQSQQWNEKLAAARMRGRIKWIAGGVAILLILLGVLIPAGRYLHHYKEAKRKAESSREGEVFLKELEEIEARLARAAGSPAKAKAVKTSFTPSASNISPGVSDIQLRPFHWHVTFQNVLDRDAFKNALKTLGPAARFNGQDFWVLSVGSQTLQKLEGMISEKNGKLPEEVYAQLSRLPDFSGEAAVSLVLNLSGEDSAPVLLEHWHLKFRLPNRFLFLENLKKIKSSFLFESPEFWVLEVTPSEMSVIKMEIQDFLGLEFFPQGRESSIENSADKVRLAIYVAEG